MRQIYYINGKSVNAETYWRTVDIKDEQEFLHKSCIKYYKANPDKFEILFRISDEKMLYWNMIAAYTETDDWKRAKALHERNMQRLNLGCFICMAILVFLPIILLILGVE
ncbi:MAG: hypothetical protein SO293_06760 [Alloprevotella sp.]|nr:hypothetical protein [Alloprevotella sp.]